MDSGNVNPYAPPVIPSQAPEPAAPDPDALRERIPVRERKGSWVLSLAAGFYSLVYIGFTLLLLASNSSDQIAGRYFLLNIPTLIALVVFIAISRRWGAYMGITFVVTHLLITIAMFQIIGADWRAIVIINAMVILPVMAIVLLAWALEFVAKSNRKR
ncbi:MAG: hypothetical protein SFV81_07580 [Pirellulaceae bacterium]|nr:hypothetical protein [Pirellulaceae bacterium]